jgi:hypothetical protein
MDPEAIRLPEWSNLTAKISPECPDNSITGACRPLVRGAYLLVSIPFPYTWHSEREHTAWTNAPLLGPPRRVSARLEPTFCLLTSWPPLGSSDAGLFSEDISEVYRGRCWWNCRSIEARSVLVAGARHFTRLRRDDDPKISLQVKSWILDSPLSVAVGERWVPR